tara:strand:+ start:1717 stop:2034 length:318 start_codon:yes stop_codon:yes gene_type:complete
MRFHIHIFSAQAEEEVLRQALRDAATHVGAYAGYTLREDGDRFTFTHVAREVSFTARVKGNMVWVADAGFTFISCTLLLARISFDHAERDFADKRGASIAFAKAA